MNNLDVMFSSKRNDWETPIDLFRELDSEFRFTLDPCASAENHKCDKYYMEKDDGLSKNWGGRGCSAILHMERKYQNGLRNHLKKARKKTHLL